MNESAFPLAESAPSSGFFDDLLKVYMPRRMCMYYEQPVIWLHAVSDALIAAAYFTIPFVLVRIVRARKDLVFGWVFWMFAVFILGCGITHVIGLADLWYPLYRIDGLAKAITAAASIATAVAIWPLVSKVTALKSPTQQQAMIDERTVELQAVNERLKAEIDARERLELAQARLAAIVESSDDAIVSKSLDGTILTWNKSAENLFGYAADEIVGKSIMLIIPPDLQEEEREIIQRIRRGERVEHFETVRVRKDGRRVHISLSLSPIRDASGQIVAASKIARDISARKRAEEERERLLASEREARTDAERASRLKDEFLATLSHELRTPLNAILGWAQLLHRHDGKADVSDGLAVIERNARLQARLIDDLLDLSRIISGKLRIEVQTIELADVIRSAVETVRPASEGKDIQIVEVLDTFTGPVRGDAARLQQVVWNLLANAIKFTGRGGKVHVALERVNSHVEITVSDTGIGISPDFLPHVFDRFRQADASTTRKHGGLGIGLAITRSIVEAHGGKVRVKSPGQGMGASFIVELPVMPTHHAPEPRPTQMGAGSSENGPGFDPDKILEGVKVLVVDDEPDARDLIRLLLQESRAQVVMAGSAADALEIMRNQKPDVLVSDIGMPMYDGYWLIHQVRGLDAREGGNVPAVALTALARSEDRRAALIAGFQSHVAKPVESAELITVVASLAGKIGRGKL